MAMLELTNRFPPDADLAAAWASGIAAFRDQTLAGSEARRPS
jgi:hypothetical protein